MSQKKSISINPSYFKIGGKKEKKKKKPKFKNKLKPNDIKKKLIAKIKAHQKKEKDKEIIEEEKENNSFKNEFQETLSYLEDMKKKKREKKQKKKEKRKNRNKTLKKSTQQAGFSSQTNDIKIDINPMNSNSDNNNSILPDPPHGCLKGGKKPTWRQYNKTLKKNKDEIINEYKIKPNFNLDSQFEERSDKLEKLKDKFKEINQPHKPKKIKIKTRRIRRKITLGKNRKGGFVGVLVKSKKTRKNIKKEVDILKHKSIHEVKDYLRKHNLTKIGSSAPDHILRTTFENAYLSGNISNNNPDILLHNWHKEEEV